MPSTKDPTIVVNPSPGKLPAGTVSASSLMFSSGGGSGAALEAHITDPMDAHFASALGIEAVYPPTFQKILSSVGGPVDGESVLDFIAAAMDAFPVRPDTIGNNDITIVNSGVPDWGALNLVGVGFTGASVVGGFTRGTNVVHTRCLVPNAAGADLFGMVFPADRGVLALYHTTGLNYATGTLVAALWLGSTDAPAGIPPALGPIFFEGARTGQQMDRTALGVGLDLFGLQSRVPYLRNYGAYPVSWLDFDANFYRYQIGMYVTYVTMGTRDIGDYILIHWKETYATSLAAIQPAQIPGNLSADTAYSAFGDWISNPSFNAARVNVYNDPMTDPIPSTSSTTSTANPTLPGPFFVMLSGVGFCTGFNLRFDLTVKVSDLFTGAYYSGTGSGVFTELQAPLVFDYIDFGYGTIAYPLTQIKNDTSGSYFSDTDAPPMGIVSRHELVNYSLSGNVPYLGPAAPTGGYARIWYRYHKPLIAETSQADRTHYFFNSFNQVGATLSTDTYEPFVDEAHRYDLSATLGMGLWPMLPAGGDDYDSTVALTSGDAKLQVIGHELRYPKDAHQVPPCYPTGNPDYQAVLMGETYPHNRQYQRVFNTGTSRATGIIRITGLPFSAFTAVPGAPVSLVADYPGGAQIEVTYPGPGYPGMKDLGRYTGDGNGCVVSVTPDGLGGILVEYNTTSLSVMNGEGKYPILVRVTFVNNLTPLRVGPTLSITEIEWLPTP